MTLNRGMATGNFFDVLGVRPALGRLFHSSDDDVSEQFDITGRNASKALVLSYSAWQNQFGGDSSVIGRRLVEPLLGWEYRVIGVAPPGFSYPSGVEYWYPMWQAWGSGVASIAVARLAPGATLAAARNEYVAIENREVPNAHFRGAHAATFTDTVLGDARPVLRVLTAAVGLLLLIACLNVGNLLLLRASGRAREIAVRRALGAGYGDIVRQLMVEAAALAIAGGVLGFLLAIGLLRALVLVAPAHLPRLDDVRLSGAPLLIAIGISSGAVLLFGVVPALFAARTNLATPLRFDSRSGSETRRRRAVRQTLVASQIALAMIMLGGAALLARSLARLEDQDAGYVSEHLSILQYSWNARQYNSKEKMIELSDRLLSRIEAIPGVTAATPIYTPPLLGLNVMQQRVDREGQTNDEAEKNPAFPLEIGGPDFFKTFGIRILRGRAFTDADGESGPYVAIVSEGVAHRFWPGEDPIGKRIRMPIDTSNMPGGNAWRTIVGVTRDTHLRSVREAAPTVYFPTRQGFWQGGVAVRSSVDIHALEPALRAAGIDADPRTVLVEDSNDGPAARRAARSAATRHHAHVGLRLGRALARGDRSLRRDDVARARSDARDWYSRRAWSDARSRAARGAPPRRDRDRDWRGRRTCWRARGLAALREPALPGRADRPRLARRLVSRPARCRCARRVLARSPRDQDRSGAGAARRLVTCDSLARCSVSCSCH